MSNWNSNWYMIGLEAKERNREAERAARRQRLLKEAFPSAERRPAVLGRVFLTLGSWLIEQGWRLHRKTEASSKDVLRWGKIEVHRWGQS